MLSTFIVESTVLTTVFLLRFWHFSKPRSYLSQLSFFIKLCVFSRTTISIFNNHGEWRVLAKHNYQGILTTAQSLINLPSLDILWKHSNQYGGKVRVGPVPFSPFATPFLTFPRTLTCSFSEYKIYPGHGGMYIRKDGQVKWILFWSSPARALPQS